LSRLSQSSLWSHTNKHFLHSWAMFRMCFFNKVFIFLFFWTYKNLLVNLLCPVLWTVCLLYLDKSNVLHTHIYHGSTSVSQRQQHVEQVINTQIYTIFTVKNTINTLWNSIIDLHIQKNYLHSKKSVYLSIFFSYFKYCLSILKDSQIIW